jgi:hypothetical protein
MSPIIAGIGAVFSVAAFVFYVIAASGYSKDYKVLKGCSWFYYHGPLQPTDDYSYDDIIYDYKFYFGLKGFLIRVSDNRLFSYYGSFTDDNVNDKCDSPGLSAFALSLVACILSFITIITNGAGGVSEETVVKAASAVLSIIACLFGMIAVGVFMTSCYNKFNDLDLFDSDKLHYGNGSILALTALFCNFFAFILASVNIAVGGSPLAEQK